MAVYDVHLKVKDLKAGNIYIVQPGASVHGHPVNTDDSKYHRGVQISGHNAEPLMYLNSRSVKMDGGGRSMKRTFMHGETTVWIDGNSVHHLIEYKPYHDVVGEAFKDASVYEVGRDLDRINYLAARVHELAFAAGVKSVEKADEG
jgi:hypothetical protein